MAAASVVTVGSIIRHRRAEIAGAIVGIAIAAYLVWTWRVPDAPANLKLGVKVATLPSAEFEFDDSTIALGRIGEGETASTSTRVRNETDRRQRVRVRGRIQEPEVGKTLQLKVTAGTRTIYEGDVDGLDGFLSDPVPIESGELEQISITGSLRRSEDGQFQGLGQDVTLLLEIHRTG